MKTIRIKLSMRLLAVVAVVCLPLCFSGCTPETGEAIKQTGPVVMGEAPPMNNQLPAPPPPVVPPGEH